MGFKVRGVGSRVLGVNVWGLGFEGFRVSALGLGGLGIQALGLGGFRDLGIWG